MSSTLVKLHTEDEPKKTLKENILSFVNGLKILKQKQNDGKLKSYSPKRFITPVPQATVTKKANLNEKATWLKKLAGRPCQQHGPRKNPI